MSSPELKTPTAAAEDDGEPRLLGAAVRASRVRQMLERPRMLSLEYQPVVDVARCRIRGYEVLARLPGDDGPAAWFAHAHQEGLGHRLDLLVLSRAIAQLPALPEDTYLSVNISTETLVHASFPGTLELAGEAADRLVLELPEDVGDEQLPAVQEALNQARALGVRVAVGDAAGGYAGLSGVGALQPDIVKIDRSIVQGASRDEVRAQLAELVRQEAVRQGAHVVAVGVETVEDLRALAASGVRYVQGYLVGRPSPVITELEPETEALLGSLATLQLGSAGLVRPADAVRTHADGEHSALTPVPGQDASPDHIQVVVTPSRRPVAVVVGEGEDAKALPVSLVVAPSWSVVEVAQAAILRERPHRYDPIVVVDDEGRLEGVLSVADLLAHLAHQLDD